MSKVNLVFEKDTYSQNEMARVKCTIENQNCDKDIQSITFLLRKSLVAQDDKKKFYKKFETLYKIKHDGIKSKD